MPELKADLILKGPPYAAFESMSVARGGARMQCSVRSCKWGPGIVFLGGDVMRPMDREARRCWGWNRNEVTWFLMEPQTVPLLTDLQ